LKRIIPILSIILLFALQAQAQPSRNPNSENGERIIKLYPNPATSFVTFDFEKNYKQGLTIYIYNGVLGKKMFESINVPAKTTVNLNDFTRGLYIYHLTDNTGKIIGNVYCPFH